MSYQSIRQSGWEKLNSMVWVWVCQALGSTLRCWQLSSLCCSCIESVLFFRRCWETLDVKSSSATSLGLQGASLRVLGNRAPQPGLWALNTKWAGTSDFGPHNSPSKSCCPTFLVGEKGFDDVRPTLWLAQIQYSIIICISSFTWEACQDKEHSFILYSRGVL